MAQRQEMRAELPGMPLRGSAGRGDDVPLLREQHLTARERYKAHTAAREAPRASSWKEPQMSLHEIEGIGSSEVERWIEHAKTLPPVVQH